jgi:hypothetical protein
MKKLFKMLEDLWVAIAFAEEGIYESSVMSDPHPRCPDSVSVLAV